MATQHPRIQVTVDEELAAAMQRVDPRPRSHSRLLRDLALRGAEAMADEEQARANAADVLLRIADGTIDHDFGAVDELAARRGERLP